MIRKLAEMLGYKDSEKEVSGQNIRVGNGVRPSAEPTRAVENQVPTSSRLSLPFFPTDGIDVKKLRCWHHNGEALYDHYIDFKKILMEEFENEFNRE